jgi:hypothetical protein
MAFAPVTLAVQQKSDRVRAAFLSQELQPFFGKERILNDPGVGRWIQWKAVSTTALVGKIPYLRGKNISRYVFTATMSEVAAGTEVSLAAARDSFAAVAIPMVYVLGLLMCCVGVVFPAIAVPRIEKHVTQALSSTAGALTAWDKSLGSNPDSDTRAER